MSLIIIGPGAGIIKNNNLWSNIKKRYKLHIIHGYINNTNYDIYPKNWDKIYINKGTNNNNNLFTLANFVLYKYLECLENKEKVIGIICGSRGGQVTLPALWRLFNLLKINSPPCIIINSGIIHSKIKWPEKCPLILLSFGLDYFNTKNQNIIYDYANKNKSFGYIIHLHNEEHLPKNQLHFIFNDLIKLMSIMNNSNQSKNNILLDVIKKKINCNILKF